jgi:hypothetical protein
MQLAEILNIFRRTHIKIWVLKGAALAWSLYPDPALRPSGDLDLLVLPDDIAQARRLLESLGYKCLGNRFEINREFYREEQFIHPKKARANCLVDLHWNLHHPFGEAQYCGIEKLLLHSWKIESSGLAFETLNPIDALIHAAVHATMIHGRDTKLIWIYDIALLAQNLRVPVDWLTLKERSMAWGARMAVEHALKLAGIWFGLQIPNQFNDFSCWPHPTQNELAAWSHAVNHDWLTILFKRFICNSPMSLKKAISLFQLFFPHPEIMRYFYPPSRDWLLPFSYIKRWHRWFRDIMMNLAHLP